MCPGRKGSWQHPVPCPRLRGSCDRAFAACRWQAGGSHLLPHVGGATARGLKARGSAMPDPRLPGRRRLVASRGCQSTVDYETPSCRLLT